MFTFENIFDPCAKSQASSNSRPSVFCSFKYDRFLFSQWFKKLFGTIQVPIRVYCSKLTIFDSGNVGFSNRPGKSAKLGEDDKMGSEF
jgi:hypothetical protein